MNPTQQRAIGTALLLFLLTAANASASEVPPPLQDSMMAPPPQVPLCKESKVCFKNLIQLDCDALSESEFDVALAVDLCAGIHICYPRSSGCGGTCPDSADCPPPTCEPGMINPCDPIPSSCDGQVGTVFQCHDALFCSVAPCGLDLTPGVDVDSVVGCQAQDVDWFDWAVTAECDWECHGYVHTVSVITWGSNGNRVAHGSNGCGGAWCYFVDYCSGFLLGSHQGAALCEGSATGTNRHVFIGVLVSCGSFPAPDAGLATAGPLHLVNGPDFRAELVVPGDILCAVGDQPDQLAGCLEIGRDSISMVKEFGSDLAVIRCTAGTCVSETLPQGQ